MEAWLLVYENKLKISEYPFTINHRSKQILNKFYLNDGVEDKEISLKSEVKI